MSQDAASTPSRKHVAVLGAGAWGRVLAGLLAEAGTPVRLWTRSAARAESLNRDAERTRDDGERGEEKRRNTPSPAPLEATSDPHRATDGCRVALLVVPTAALGGLVTRIAEEPARVPPAFVSCSKGLIAPGLNRPSRLVHEAFPERPVAVLSGPNLASEIARGLPAAATVASSDPALAAAVQRLFGRGRFRVYTDDDPVGVEVAGAYKNVIALAAGMSDALGLGENAKASLITRGLAETVRLGRHLGGKERTFYGLAGVGDLVATCASGASRNHTAGERLALGATVAEFRAENLTAEGLGTVRAVVAEADRAGLHLPIARQVHAVAYEAVPAAHAVHDLLAQDPRGEWEEGARGDRGGAR